MSKYEKIINNIVDAIITINKKGIIVEANLATYRMFGYEDDQLIGHNISILMPQPYRIKHNGYLENYHKTGIKKVIGTIRQLYGEKSDGNRFPIELSVSEMNDGTYVGVIRDVSKIKKLEKEKEEMENHYKQIFDLSMDLICTASTTDEYMKTVNQTCEKMLGYTQEEFLSQPYTHFVHPDDLDITVNERKEIAEGKTAFNFENRYITKSGDCKWIAWNAMVIPNTNNIIGYGRDITEIKKQNEELEKALILAKENQRKAEIAEGANQAKNFFLSRMSHELRTPLNSIIGFSQLIMIEQPIENEYTDYIRTIYKSGKHLLNLINDVLNISRIESGNMTYSIESVNLRKVIKEVVDILYPTADLYNITMIYNYRTSNYYINADYQKIKQTLINLVSNAIKYNKKNGLVKIYCLQGADYVTINIEDTGIGIANDKISELFTPFSRLGAEKTTIEGTGLGLALSKSLVEGMGGEIGVESVLGKGSKFWIRFKEYVPSVINNIEEIDEVYKIDCSCSSNKKILYIEDNIDNYKLVEHIVKKFDIQFLSSIYGSEGIKTAINEKPDMILLDLHLPDMHGSEVLVEIKKHLPDVNIIILSADASSGEIERLLKIGAYKYLTKPVDVHTLINLIKRIV